MFFQAKAKISVIDTTYTRTIGCRVDTRRTQRLVGIEEITNDYVCKKIWNKNIG